MIRLLGQTEETDGDGTRRGITINGIRCDPATAELTYTSIAGEDCYVPDERFRRFDEALYRNADGYWFLVRPLAPDEAQKWLEDERHDDILARELFPVEED